MSMQRWIAAAAITLAVAGCAGLPGRTQPPRLTLAGVSLVDASLLEQRFRLQLRVQNPNDFDLPLRALDYRLDIAGKRFAEGVATKPVTIPPYGSELVEVDAVGSTAATLRQLGELVRMDRPLSYSLSGSAAVGSNWMRLPFSQTGEVELPLSWLRGFFGGGRDDDKRPPGQWL